MKTALNSFLLFITLSILCGIIYPSIVTIISGIAYPYQASGSLIVRNGKVIGSELIGQQFSDLKLFWSRPSATAPFAYNAMASSGSNLSPTNPALKEAVEGRINKLRQESFAPEKQIPSDLVTTSASGLDPHISIAAARYQIPRLSHSTGFSEAELLDLVNSHIEGQFLGVFGESRVNVLLLNLELQDKLLSK